jgi:hypothetical protein
MNIFRTKFSDKNIRADFIAMHVYCSTKEGSGASQFSRVARFFLTQYTKTMENMPSYQNFTKWPINIPNTRKIFQMTTKYTSILHSKALPNLPKLRFLVLKQTIWQPCNSQPGWPDELSKILPKMKPNPFFVKINAQPWDKAPANIILLLKFSQSDLSSNCPTWSPWSQQGKQIAHHSRSTSWMDSEICFFVPDALFDIWCVLCRTANELFKSTSMHLDVLFG